MDLNNKDALNEDTRLRRDHFLRVHGLMWFTPTPSI
jgi:hypothetical protein